MAQIMNIFDYMLQKHGGNIDFDEYGNAYFEGDIISRIDLFKGVEWFDYGLYFMPKELYEKYSGIVISVADVKEVDYVRRPYYRMRGKPVSKEQAFEIIRRSDNFFYFYVDNIKEHPDFVRCIDFDNWVIMKNHTSMGWIHADGTIGVNGITQKYPEIETMLMEWIMFLLTFPYLDLVIGVTVCDEVLEYYEEFETFEDAIAFGIYVHDNTVEILNKADAVKKYKEYDRAYGQPSEKFVADYYDDNKIVQVSEQYLRKCIESYGLNADEELGKVPEYVWKEGVLRGRR